MSGEIRPPTVHTEEKISEEDRRKAARLMVAAGLEHQASREHMAEAAHMVSDHIKEETILDDLHRKKRKMAHGRSQEED